MNLKAVHSISLGGPFKHDQHCLNVSSASFRNKSIGIACGCSAKRTHHLVAKFNWRELRLQAFMDATPVRLESGQRMRAPCWRATLRIMAQDSKSAANTMLILSRNPFSLSTGGLGILNVLMTDVASDEDVRFLQKTMKPNIQKHYLSNLFLFMSTHGQTAHHFPSQSFFSVPISIAPFRSVPAEVRRSPEAAKGRDCNVDQLDKGRTWWNRAAGGESK